MSDAFWVAMFAGLPPTIAVIVTSVLQLRKTNKVAEDAKAAAEGKDTEASGKLDVIHTLVNSRLHDEIREKEQALARVKELEAEINKRYEE